MHRAAFRQALPWIPELHTPDEDRAYFKRLVTEQHVWVADVDGDVAALAAWADGWLNQLYVAPEHQGRGHGRQLLDQVKRAHSEHAEVTGFSLWTFQRNFRARRFYEMNGLVPTHLTAGQANEEKEPDIKYEWRSDSARHGG